MFIFKNDKFMYLILFFATSYHFLLGFLDKTTTFVFDTLILRSTLLLYHTFSLLFAANSGCPVNNIIINYIQKYTYIHLLNECSSPVILRISYIFLHRYLYVEWMNDWMSNDSLSIPFYSPSFISFMSHSSTKSILP